MDTNVTAVFATENNYSEINVWLSLSVEQFLH